MFPGTTPDVATPSSVPILKRAAGTFISPQIAWGQSRVAFLPRVPVDGYFLIKSFAFGAAVAGRPSAGFAWPWLAKERAASPRTYSSLAARLRNGHGTIEWKTTVGTTFPRRMERCWWNLFLARAARPRSMLRARELRLCHCAWNSNAILPLSSRVIENQLGT